MSTQARARKLKKSSDSAAVAGLGRGGGVVPNSAATAIGRGGGSAGPRPSLGGAVPFSHGFPSSAAPWMDSRGFPNSASTWMDSRGFPYSPFPPSPCGGDFSTRHVGENIDPSSPGSWDNNLHPSGGFMSYFSNQPHNSHLVGAMNQPHNNDGSSPPEVEVLSGNPSNENDNVRTEKRIMWTADEDVRVMSAWLEHSTDSTCGADKCGGQCKDRWHKINKWTDLFECAYIKARRVFTSGYLDQMWIDAAHKFYVDDNKGVSY